MKSPIGRDARGAVMVEFLIAYMPVLVAFLMFWQVGELLVAQMVVERASSAAGRAAVVVLPDDPAFYGTEPQDSYAGERKREIRLAAGMMLAASPHLSENFTVNVQNIPGGDTVEEVTVEVDAEFRCNRLKWVCGSDGVAVLKSTSQATYQGARYQYEPSDLSNLTSTNSSTSEPGCSDTDTPNAGGSGNHGGSSQGGVPGKGGASGKGGNGGRGGNDPDSSGSCPAGETMQSNGTCAKSRGNGLCDDDQHQDKKTGKCVCNDGSPVDAKTGKCSSDCRYGSSNSKVEPKQNSVCPSPMSYLLGPADNTGECCTKSNKRDSNGCEQYNCSCAPQTKAKQPHSNIQATFVSHDFGNLAQLTTGTGKFPSCTDTCSASNSKDVEGTAEGVQDQFVKKQFNTMCGSGTYTKGDLLKKTRVDKKQTGPDGKPLTVVVYDQLQSQDAKDLWQALDDYCTQVQSHIAANGTITPIGSHLAEDSKLQTIEGQLASAYDKVKRGNASDYSIVGNQLSGGNANHTETKVIELLKEWAKQSAADQPRALLEHGTLMLEGEASPCKNCDQDLAAFASEYHVAIQYQFDHIYTSGPARTDPKAKTAFLDPPGGSFQGGSVEFHGSIEYDEDGNRKYVADQQKLCGK